MAQIAQVPLKNLALSVVTGIVLLLSYVPHVHAQLTLNFQGHPDADFILGGYEKADAPIACAIPNSAPNIDCLIGEQDDPDTTIFRNERVGTPTGIYWHVVIIDPDNNFAMEMYTPVSGFFLSNSGGREPVFFTLNGNLEQWSGNGWDPLESTHKTFGPDNVSFSGNATGDPRKVMIRQILGAGELAPGTQDVRDWLCDPGEFCQEFLKAEFDLKPIITQQIESTKINALFELDMSEISYSEQNIAGDIRIKLGLFDESLPSLEPFSFDSTTDRFQPSVTGGKYTYTAGMGWYDDGDGDSFYAFEPGSYLYEDGEVKTSHLEQDWMMFYDPSQNLFPGNKAKCEALDLDACNLPPINYDF